MITIESKRDGLCVIHNGHGVSIVCTSIATPLDFGTVAKAERVLATLRKTMNLHSGFKVHQGGMSR